MPDHDNKTHHQLQPEPLSIGTPSPPTFKKRSFLSSLIVFCILLATWLVLSGRFDAMHILLGIVSCLVVTLYVGDLLLVSPNIRALPVLWLRFIRYIPWLLYQVFLANLHVLRLVFHPKMMDHIDPGIIEFKSKLKSEMARVTFANSITLTPGTITVKVTPLGNFAVHAIDKPSGEPLPGEMETRVGKIFEE